MQSGGGVTGEIAGLVGIGWQFGDEFGEEHFVEAEAGWELPEDGAEFFLQPQQAGREEVG